MVNGRYLKRLSLKFRTRNRGIRPISSGMYSRRLLRRERTVIPLQLPSYEEKKSNIEEIYLKLNTSLLFKFHSILYLCDFMDLNEAGGWLPF